MSATVERLAQSPREMTIAHAAHVLDRSDDHVARAIKTGNLESRADPGRGLRRQYILITREALLAYIVRSTSGDRLTLMRAIEQLLPKPCQDLAQSIVSPQPQPDNVIPMRAARRPQSKPETFDHPDLFRSA